MTNQGRSDWAYDDNQCIKKKKTTTRCESNMFQKMHSSKLSCHWFWSKFDHQSSLCVHERQEKISDVCGRHVYGNGQNDLLPTVYNSFLMEIFNWSNLASTKLTFHWKTIQRFSKTDRICRNVVGYIHTSLLHVSRVQRGVVAAKNTQRWIVVNCIL